MHQGRIVESGRAADVFDRPRDAYTRTLLGAIPRINPEWDRRRRAAPRTTQGVESA
ncbi:hypothetical protein [Streptomyces sp. NPDC002790]